MEKFLENIERNFCKICKKRCNNCMDVRVINDDDITLYKCVNYFNDTPLEEYKTYIKYDFHDDDGNFIAIIEARTPIEAIVELRKHYDFVKNKE